MLKSSPRTIKKQQSRANNSKEKMMSNSRADGSKLHKEHLTSNNQRMNKIRSLRRRASVTPATPTTPPRWPSNGHSMNGRAKKNLISEY